MSKDWSESIYEKLINEEDARACKAIDESACQEVPGNFVRIILSQFLTNLGDAIINPKVTLPWILQSLGAPAFLLGWLVPIRESGSLVPQLAIASWIRRMPVRKWAWVTGSVLQALCVLGIGLVAMTLQGAAAGWTVIALLVVFSLSRGLSSVASKDVLGKTIPKKQRGQVSGWSSSAAGLVTMGLAAMLFLSWYLQADTGNAFYGWALVAGAAIWLMAAGMFSTVTEFAGETGGGRNGMIEAFKQLALLKTDKDFRDFVITRSLFLCTALSAPYYIVLAHDALGSDVWVLALFMFASGLAGLVSAPVWGRFSDQSSRRVMMMASTGAAIIGIALFLIARFIPELMATFWLMPLLYFVLTICHQGVRVGRKTYLVDMAEGDKRTSYVSVSNTVIGIVLLALSGLGSLTAVMSMEALILFFSVMAIAGVLMAARLPEVTD
ncbi:MAG: MFS transporter [Oceanospirillaceae bacterium]|nr:MFS transporter [Oceanospirillaceae bacterium]MBT11594.1 MFS transporter [Oceanospirillaceae bacterium]|tara:strand:+ start:40527 stop:41843 length:1317 start_codon:yes stop_codon:yes gene_type:complete